MEPILDFEDYTIVWVAVLQIEAEAALGVLDNVHEGRFETGRGDDYIYFGGDIKGHKVVIATWPAGQNYGVASAAALVNQVKSRFTNLWFALLVGIAAGLPIMSRDSARQRDIRLGDVLVCVPDQASTGIVQYDLGKNTTDGFLINGRQAQTPDIVRAAFRTIQLRDPRPFKKGNVLSRYLAAFQEKTNESKFLCPKQEMDRLHILDIDEGRPTEILVERKPRDESERSLVWYGAIGSGSSLMKNPQQRDELRDKYNLIGLEMEAAGVMNSLPTGVIRGVCDYGDSYKNDDWQPYAAAVAAAYAKRVLYSITPKKSPGPKVHPYTVLPLTRNTDFIARRDIFDVLDKMLAPTETYHTTAIWGLGGCGKTQIALEYAYLHQQKTSCSVFWVRGDSEASFTQTYSTIAKIAGLSSDLKGEDLLYEVQQWIQQRTSWLLVLDNVDDISIFKRPYGGKGNNDLASGVELLRFVPKSSSGDVIWTSRDGAILGQIVDVNRGVEVKAMTEQQSLKLFRTLSGWQGTEKASAQEQELLGLLQMLPLAIAQAAAYIRKTKVSLDYYVKMFKESEDQESSLLSWEFQDMHRSDVPNSVMRTWLISMRQITRESPCGEMILNTIAYFDNQGLPFELLRAAVGSKFSESDVLLAAGRLIEYSFLQVQETGGSGPPTYQQHRLVQLATRRALTTTQAHAFAGKALDAIANIFPDGSHETWNACKLYLPHALKMTAWSDADRYIHQAPGLFSRIGNYYWEQGLSGEAEKLQVQVLELRKSVLGEKHPDTIKSMANLASTWHQQGRSDEAEKLDMQVLELQKSVLGEKHPYTITAMANLASTWSQQGRSDEAEKLQVQVLELQKSVLGEKHPDTILAMASLASTWWQQRRSDEAEKLQVQVLELRKSVLGEKHPDTIKSMANLASTWHQQGRSDEAEKLDMQVLELQKSVLGEKHPYTITAMANLASTWSQQGRSDEAEKLQVQVLELQKSVLGEKHPDTILAMANLASSWWQQGRSDEAENLDVQVLELRKSVLGEKHPDTIRAMASLAVTYWSQNRYKEAERLEMEVLNLRRQILREKHPDTILAMENLAATYDKQGRHSEAEALRLEALNTGRAR